MIVSDNGITEFSTYQPKRVNLKDLIGRFGLYCVVDHEDYFGNACWIVRKNVFTTKTKNKLQELIDNEIQNVVDDIQNRKTLRIQNNKENILRVLTQDEVNFKENLLTPIRVIVDGIILDKNTYDIIIMKNNQDRLFLINSGIYNAFIKEGIQFYCTNSIATTEGYSDSIILYKDDQRIGVYASIPRGFGCIPMSMKGLIIEEEDQKKYRKG